MSVPGHGTDVPAFLNGNQKLQTWQVKRIGNDHRNMVENTCYPMFDFVIRGLHGGLSALPGGGWGQGFHSESPAFGGEVGSELHHLRGAADM